MSYESLLANEVYPQNMPTWEMELPSIDYDALASTAAPQYYSYRDSDIGEATNRFIDASAFMAYHNNRAGYCALHRYFIICELLALHRLRKSKVRQELLAYNQRMLELTDYAFARYTEERQALRSTYFSRRVLIAADKYAWLNALIQASSTISHPQECHHAIRVQTAAWEYYADVVFTEFRTELTDEAYNHNRENNLEDSVAFKRRFKINHVRVPEPNNNYGTIPESFSIGNSARVKVNTLDVIDSGENITIRTELVLPKEDYEIEHRFSTRVVRADESVDRTDRAVLRPDTVNHNNNRSIEL